jgi:hypothetical protein
VTFLVHFNVHSFRFVSLFSTLLSFIFGVNVKRGVRALALTIDANCKFGFLPTFDYHLDFIPYICV